MELNNRQKKLLDDARSNCNKALAEFLTGPQTKLLMSLVPETNPPELLSTLLRAAFETGHAAGIADMTVMLIESVHKSRES